jgi:hypothetical protein
MKTIEIKTIGDNYKGWWWWQAQQEGYAGVT